MGTMPSHGERAGGASASDGDDADAMTAQMAKTYWQFYLI